MRKFLVFFRGSYRGSGADNTVKIRVFEYAGGGLDYFDGQIDDVRIFDRALSEAEIAVITQ